MAKNTRSRGTKTEVASKTNPRGKQNTAGYRKRVYDIVRRIPAGRVMTYGQIAIILGAGYTPRTVGFVMHASEEENVPWQRVINSLGACSTGRIILPSDMQRRILEAEGITFDERGRCDLNLFGWAVDEEERQQSDKQVDKLPSLFRRRASRNNNPKG